MSRKTRVTSALLTAALLLNACGSDSDSGSGAEAASNDITGSLSEWEVTVDSTTAKAGEVNFTVANKGTIGHEFLVVKTDITPGEIPLDGDRFPEDGPGIEVIDEIGEFPKDTTETLTVTLEPGSYQLVCNLPGHYTPGMYIGFEVVA